MANKILLVEDHEEIWDFLSRRLKRRGFDVVIAQDGQQGLDMARAENPNVILLDMNLPVMDGWTFREIQGSDPALQTIPVVIISAISNVQQQRHPVPAAAYLPKPLNFALLLETVTRFCCPP